MSHSQETQHKKILHRTETNSKGKTYDTFTFPKDDLDFTCESCQDTPGGCPQCSFRRKKDKE